MCYFGQPEGVKLAVATRKAPSDEDSKSTALTINVNVMLTG